MNLRQCTLCPRKCGADRVSGFGICGAGNKIRIARAALHFGEEPCITGKNGSGTVFFSGCNLHCRFCQNASISHGGFGEDVSEERLAEIFMQLQSEGAENINLVTPSHFAPMVAEVLKSVKSSLTIPVVCNCSGYESDEILQCFEGLVDIYLADLKYFSPEKSLRYSDAYDYFLVASAALRKMFEQVGPCVFSHEGMLQRGLLIRHLVLPNGKADSEQILRWIAQEFNAKDIRISLMRQYTPCGDLSTCPEINRKLFSLEYTSILKIASEFGLEGYMQGRDCDNFSMTPAFDLTGVRKDAL